MFTKSAYKSLEDSLRKSITHCQYEFRGYPFDLDYQYAFGANWYGTTTDFLTEFDMWIYNADQAKLEVYIKSVYYGIAHFGVLFSSLVDDYQSSALLNPNKMESGILESKSYQRAYAYKHAIYSTCDYIRKLSDQYVHIELVPYRELTNRNFTIDGEFTANEQINSIENTTDASELKVTKPRHQRKSTISRDERIKKLVEDYQRMESKNQFQAMKLAADKEGVSLATVERAVGWRNR